MNKGQRRAQALGMPWGTAAHRLRKLILFSLLVKHGENVCFKCRGPIESADDLSIEHKEPWEGKNVDLFWDMNNIAFSHARCNVPHTYRARFSHILEQSPPGRAWCSTHQDYIPVGRFWRNRAQKSGYESSCRDH